MMKMYHLVVGINLERLRRRKNEMRFFKSTLCLFLCLTIMGIVPVNANEKGNAFIDDKIIDIEEISSDTNIDANDLVDLFMNMPNELNKLESQPQTVTYEEEGEIFIKQVLQTESGLLLVKEQSLSPVILASGTTSHRISTHYFVKDPLGASTAVTLWTDLDYEQILYSPSYCKQRITGINGRSSGYLYSVSYSSSIPASSQSFSESPVAYQYFYISFLFQGSPFHTTYTNTIKFNYSGSYTSTWN